MKLTSNNQINGWLIYTSIEIDLTTEKPVNNIINVSYDNHITSGKAVIDLEKGKLIFPDEIKIPPYDETKDAKFISNIKIEKYCMIQIRSAFNFFEIK